ncbi:MAG: matrixin family metalloprotease, partial [Anaerolineales bacterium]
MLFAGALLLFASTGRHASADPTSLPVVEIERWFPLEGGGLKRVTVLVDTRIADPAQVAAAYGPPLPGVNAQFVAFGKWAKSDIPVQVAYDDSGDPPGIDGEADVAQAMSVWGAVPGQSFSFAAAGSPGSETPACITNFGDQINTVRFSNLLHPGVLGETCTLFFGAVDGMERIVEFDMHLAAALPWSDGPVTPPAHFDLPTVILHELGHAFGLDHSTAGTVMQPSLKSGAQIRSPSADDIAGMRHLYGPG